MVGQRPHVQPNSLLALAGAGEEDCRGDRLRLAWFKELFQDGHRIGVLGAAIVKLGRVRASLAVIVGMPLTVI
jgi:hypothetical protein